MVSIPTIGLFTMMYFLPETPYWLVENDRIETARKSLEFFRVGAAYDDISEELEEIQDKHRSKMMQKGSHIVWKLLKMSHFNFGILAFSTDFWPIKTDLSGNSVCPQASVFQKLAKLDPFWHFLMNSCLLKM